MADTERAPESTAPRPELWAPRISVAVALLLALAYAFSGPGLDDFCLDDAWIHLAYAKSLRLGDGLSYNPGDWETGFSSPLWLLLLAAWPTEPEPVVAVQLLGALLHAATAGLASAIALDLISARATVARPLPAMSVALLAGILCATSPTLLQGASSGMEIPLTAALLLACLRASLREQWLVAGVLGFLVELARPEALACLLGFAVVLGASRRKPWALASVLGAALALASWVLYCVVVSGWPWPNTAYVKTTVGQQAGLGPGLDYLVSQVLIWEPWVVGIGGLALLLAALWTELSGRGVLERAPAVKHERRFEIVALLAGWLAGMLGVAISRPLDPGILFYQARYFAIFAAIPPIILAMGVARTHRVLSLVLVIPVALVTGLAIPTTARIQHAQERGVALLHGDPARYVARELPRDAVIAVEGAGAMRYRTPRTMTIVDVVGLNDAAIAHAVDDNARACVLIEREPGYFVLPDHIAAALSQVFELRVIADFVDPEWAQIEEPREVRVLLLEVVGVRQRWAQRCGRTDSSI
ncbi:MAG TPA: hypothetical protein VK034_18935 [Enhygromyxa sp.]|nr:hypothetical protein [Enhygromyxa sp.]